MTETLRGKTAAYVAMAFGRFCVFVPPMSVVLQSPSPFIFLHRLLTSQLDSGSIEQVTFAAIISPAEAIVLLLVAMNTWRKTGLQARDGTLSLTFAGLFGIREHSWPFGQIVKLGVDRTLEAGFSDPRLELVFRVHGGEHVLLFADHGELDLVVLQACFE